MNLSDRLRRLWALTDPLPPEPNVPVIEPEVLPTVEAPFLTFPCKKCDTIIIIQQRLDPGQAAVTICDNCGESWSVFLPQCVIMETEKFPQVWKQTSSKSTKEKKNAKGN